MPFLLDGNPTQGEISEAVNYLLSNFGQTVSADPATGEITGPTGSVSGYLYKYLAVRYADSFDGTLNFSNSPTGRLYYGLRNTSSTVESENPNDYIWTMVTGGFGSTKFLWYLTTGGRQIQITVATDLPNAGWVEDDGTAIDLDIITGAGGVANFVVIRLTNDSSAPTDAECIAAIGRTPIDGDLCTLNYNSGISSIVYKYTGGWAIFQSYITGDIIVAETITGDNIAANTITAANIEAGTITGNEIAAGTITANNIEANSITINEINNVATGQIIAGSFNMEIFTSVGLSYWTCPDYVYKAKVTVIGGGGGGYPYLSSNPGSGVGGGGGGACISIFDVVPGVTYTAVVGGGGAANTNGSTSTFSGPGITTLIAYGGSRGPSYFGQGGAGGAATGGILNFTGGSGGGLTGNLFESNIGGFGGPAAIIGTTTRGGTNASANSGSGGGGGVFTGGLSAGGAGGSGLVIVEF